MKIYIAYITWGMQRGKFMQTFYGIRRYHINMVHISLFTGSKRCIFIAVIERIVLENCNKMFQIRHQYKYGILVIQYNIQNLPECIKELTLIYRQEISFSQITKMDFLSIDFLKLFYTSQFLTNHTLTNKTDCLIYCDEQQAFKPSFRDFESIQSLFQNSSFELDGYRVVGEVINKKNYQFHVDIGKGSSVYII